MNFIQAIILGILQGLTEFLPISSSGHLVIFQKFFGFSSPPIAFDTLVHLGTLVALLFFFWRDIKKVFQHLTREIKLKKRGDYIGLFFSLIIGSIPIVIWGILLKEKIYIIFDSLLLVGISFLFTAIILFITVFIKEYKKELSKIKFVDAAIIGIFQAFAILPGISRSGVTISSSLFQGLKKEAAFKFSFFLGIIAILGANLLQAPEISDLNQKELFSGFLGFLFSATTGFFALKWLKRVITKSKLHYFGIYCAILGTICILLTLI